MTTVQTDILDNIYRVETPEAVTLEFRLAGPIVRSASWLLDFAIRSLVYGVFLITLTFLGHFGIGMMLIIFFLLEWIYPVYFELIWGATPGKRAMGIMVVHTNGTPISWQASFIRNVLRSVDMLPVAYGFGLVTMLVSPHFQRLGDMAADTLVIYRPSETQFSKLAAGLPLEPPLGLTQEQNQALISFAERKSTLTEDRAIELAEHLTPITGQSGTQAVYSILGFAHWLVRGK